MAVGLFPEQRDTGNIDEHASASDRDEIDCPVGTDVVLRRRKEVRDGLQRYKNRHRQQEHAVEQPAEQLDPTPTKPADCIRRTELA